MQSRSFLRLLTPLALAALLVACGDDGAGGSGDTNEPAAKKDAGIKRRDGGAAKTSKDDETDDETADEDEDEAPVVKDAGAKDTGVKKVDAGKTSCTTDNDCVSDEMSGIGCCDKPTKMCFFTEEDTCPAPKTPPTMQPPYN